jgi:hypothetical protein
MRSDYQPATTVCCICGHLLKDGQICGQIDGIVSYTEGTVTKIDPFMGWFCHECLDKVRSNVQGGIKAAKKRRDEHESELGE